MMRMNGHSHSTLPTYAEAFRTEMARVNMSVRGPKGLADQTGISASRFNELLGGSEPTHRERRVIWRALPRMRFLAVRPSDAQAHPMRSSPDSELGVRKSSDEASTPIEGALVEDTTNEPTSPRVPMLRPHSFGEWLRAAREEEEVTQAQVGELMDVTQGTVSAWETDRAIPIAIHFEKLLVLFPVLRGAPQPNVRDIEKPKGNVVGTASRTGQADEIPAHGTGDRRFDDTTSLMGARETLPAADAVEGDVTSGATGPVNAANMSGIALRFIAFGMRLSEAKAVLGDRFGAIAKLLQAATEASLSTGEIAELIAAFA